MLIHDSLGKGAFSNSPALYTKFDVPRTLAGPLPPVLHTLQEAYPLWYAMGQPIQQVAQKSNIVSILLKQKYNDISLMCRPAEEVRKDILLSWPMPHF